MEKPRQRDTKGHVNKSFIIETKRIWWRDLIVCACTLFVWFYCITVLYFFIDAMFSLDHKYPSLYKISFQIANMDIQGIVTFGFILFIILYLLFLGWTYYNKKKYAHLTRRKYPEMATKEDLLSLKMIDANIYEELQNNKIIVLETNPIKNIKNIEK